MSRLGPWSTDRQVAVAVSGGADSLCLAWLAAGWGRPLALIVDHGLRHESSSEATEAASRLVGFGVESRILRLDGLLHGPGLAERARLARYAALIQAAAAEGLSDLLLGHHARDQAETLLIRAEAGSGPAGLAGMDRIVETTSLRLVRPLLSIPPERLRATLIAAGIGWSEDPGNADSKATRTRMRRRLTDGRVEPGSSQAASCRYAAEVQRAALLAERVSVFPEGYALLTAGPIEPGALAAVIRALTGAPYPARSLALARLAENPRQGTLGGVRFMPAGRLGTGTLVVREAAALAPPVAARQGCVWDRRFVLTTSGPLPDHTTLGAVGDDAACLRDLTALPSCVLRTLPALRAPGCALAVPHLGIGGWTNAGIRLTLRPANPVAGAAFGMGDAQHAPDHHVLTKAPLARLPL